MKETETRFTTDALVIKEMSVGESDRLVTLFTRDYGLIRAFAAGAKSVRSKKGAATSLLTYGSFTLLRKKDTYKIYGVQSGGPFGLYARSCCLRRLRKI